jgi:glutamate racemase
MQVVEPEVFDPAIDKAAEAIRNIIRPLSTMASISDRLFRTEIAEVSEQHWVSARTYLSSSH